MRAACPAPPFHTSSPAGRHKGHSLAVAVAGGSRGIQGAQRVQVGGRLGSAAARAAAAAVGGIGGLRRQLAQAHVLDARQAVQLALQRAVLADVLQVAAAHGAEGRAHRALGRPRLRAAAQEDDLRAVDGVACWGRRTVGMRAAELGHRRGPGAASAALSWRQPAALAPALLLPHTLTLDAGDVGIARDVGHLHHIVIAGSPHLQGLGRRSASCAGRGRRHASSPAQCAGRGAVFGSGASLRVGRGRAGRHRVAPTPSRPPWPSRSKTAPSSPGARIARTLQHCAPACL